MESFYNEVLSAGFLGTEMEILMLGFLMLIVGLLPQSKIFERLVGSRIRGHLHQAYATYGLPLMIVLMEMQRTRRGGSLFRFLGFLVIVVIVVIIAVLALIGFLIYRFLRRR